MFFFFFGGGGWLGQQESTCQWSAIIGLLQKSCPHFSGFFIPGFSLMSWPGCHAYFTPIKNLFQSLEINQPIYIHVCLRFLRAAGCEITGFSAFWDRQNHWLKTNFLLGFPSGNPVKRKVLESQTLGKAFWAELGKPILGEAYRKESQKFIGQSYLNTNSWPACFCIARNLPRVFYSFH